MNKNFLAGFIVLVLVGGAAYMWLNKTNIGMEQTSTPSEIVLTIAEQNESGEYGTATLTEADGKVKVTLNLSGAPTGVTQPAHIHIGSCPNVGAVKYPLTSPVDGTSVTMLDVPLSQLRSELPLGLNVHKSTTQTSDYVSCGDLVL